MNVLVIESDEKLSTKVVDCLNEIFNDSDTKITTASNMTAAMGLFTITGLKFGLIVGAETVDDGRHTESGNWLQLMQGFRSDGLRVPCVILTDTPAVEHAGFVTIYRDSAELEEDLMVAVLKLLRL